jgi:hypothetical protein
MTRTLIASTLFVHFGFAMLAAQPGTLAESRAGAFVSALAQAMSRGDRAAVAEMVHYPLNASVGGIGIPIASRAELIRAYGSIFTAELRCLVDDSVANGPSALSIDAGGVTFGNRRIHADEVAGALKITSIDVPPATGIGAPPNPPARRVTRRGVTQYSGRLYGDGVDTYIISASRGDVVQARIEQFPGRSAAVRVVEQKTGRSPGRPAPSVVEGAGAPAPRVWSGTIQESGDYRVEVVRLAPYCQPSFTYLLTIAIK